MDHCPKCGSKHVNCGDPEWCDCGNDEVMVPMDCDDCGYNWMTYYTFNRWATMEEHDG